MSLSVFCKAGVVNPDQNSRIMLTASFVGRNTTDYRVLEATAPDQRSEGGKQAHGHNGG